MKKLVIATLLFSSATLSLADTVLVSADSSPLTKLCIDAATSTASLQSLAAKNGIFPANLDTLQCNGMSIRSFVRQYGKAKNSAAPDGIRAGAYLVKKADASPLTELCAAMVISPEEYAKAKKMYFKEEPNIDAELMCNGKPLKTFVRKLRGSAVMVSQR